MTFHAPELNSKSVNRMQSRLRCVGKCLRVTLRGWTSLTWLWQALFSCLNLFVTHMLQAFYKKSNGVQNLMWVFFPLCKPVDTSAFRLPDSLSPKSNRKHSVYVTNQMSKSSKAEHHNTTQSVDIPYAKLSLLRSDHAYTRLTKNTKNSETRNVGVVTSFYLFHFKPKSSKSICFILSQNQSNPVFDHQNGEQCASTTILFHTDLQTHWPYFYTTC